MHRFFVPANQIPNITGSDAHQIKNVLRLKPGNEIELLDGSGKVYFAKIIKIHTDHIACDIVSVRQASVKPAIEVTLAQCLPKAKKMDLIIQKCTELGVAQIIPVRSERSIPKGEKLARWQKIAKEAAEQCGRTTIPTISRLTKFQDVLEIKADLKLMLWEMEQELTLKNALANRDGKNLLILIGPEGGFSHQEAQQAKQAGFLPVTLGPNILRTETVGMAILSMINYEFYL